MSNLDKDIYSSLNEEQKSVVIAPLDKHIRIVAGAGSGKTTTILYRIKYLLEKQVDPSTILLTTFNVDAAEVLKDRLKNKLKIDEKILKKMFIGTIDSISYRFYRMYFSQESYRGVQEYSTELLKFLNTDDGKEKILNRFIYVFFDEFQDANNIQFEILKKFSDKSYLTVIGDDAQNIYQWRGSNIDYILNFDKYFTNTVTFKLEKNYRSTPEIIVFANESIKNNQDQIKKSLIPTKNSSGVLPLIVKQYSKTQHASYIVDKIRHYISRGIKLDEIAVLSRNNFGLKNLEEEFEKSKLPYISLISDNDNSKIKVIPNHICLTTIHKAKGLEWDVVFLIDCEDSKFPSEIDPISIEEERRLFYVGITRPKTYLEITFTSNNLTRFVGELPSNLYEFPRFNQKYLDYSNKRNVKFETSVVKLISLLESKHIEELRSLKILPDLVNVNTKVSTPTILDDYISQYNFNQDYGSFIDRYICRKMNDKKDRDADLVINSLEVNAAQHQIYIKYKANIIHKLDKNNINSLNNISKNSEDPEYLVEVDSKDLASLKMICNKIIELCKKYDLEINDVLVLPQSYLPAQFKTKMLDSYKQFKKDKYTMRNIYDISLCSSIRDNRRRLLYRDIYDKFTSNEKIFKNIDKWCDNYQNKNISLKIILNDLDRMIDGEIDMLDSDTNTLIDFKVSSSEIKLDWILQLLIYTSLLRNLKKIQIDTIAVYNPLLGILVSFDVKNWSYENKLLDYLIKVRSDKLLKPDLQTNISYKPKIEKIVTKEKFATKKVNLEEEIFDFTQEELDAMIQVDKKIKEQKQNNNIEKIRIRPKKRLT